MPLIKSIFERELGAPLWRYPTTLAVLGTLPTDRVEHAKELVRLARSRLECQRVPSLHSFRIVVLEHCVDPEDNFETPQLIISAVFEEDADHFLRTLLQLSNGVLRDILRECDGFPRIRDSAIELRWLKDHALRAQTYHIGTLRDRLATIRGERDLHDAISGFVDQQLESGLWDGASVVRIRDDIRTFVKGRPDLPQGSRLPLSRITRLLEIFDLFRVLVLLLLVPTAVSVLFLAMTGLKWSALSWLIPASIIGLTAMLVAVIRWHELTEPDVVVTPSRAHVQDLMAVEDFDTQNQLTLLTPVRPSHFRRWNIWFTLWLANAFSKHVYKGGYLAGIPTIHYARFYLINDSKHMLFMSDFDGGWDRYLFAFTGVGSLAVVPIWSNLFGCPKARFQRFPSPGFFQRFLPFTRAFQRVTQFWYSAIPDFTVLEIKRNALLRQGLFRSKTTSQIEQWLQLI